MNEFRVKHCYGFHGKVVTEFFDCAPAPLQVEQLASSPGTEKSSRCLQDLCSQNRHLHISFIGIQRPLRLSLCLCPYLSPKSPKWPRTTSKNNTSVVHLWTCRAPMRWRWSGTPQEFGHWFGDPNPKWLKLSCILLLYFTIPLVFLT